MMDHAVINNTFSPSRPKNTVLNNLPTDARLSQLPVILDVEVMREKLQDRMFASDSEQTQFVVQRCEILQIRYKPASSCMVSYLLSIEDLANGEQGEQILCGRAFPAGISQTQWEKASVRMLVQPRFGTPLIHLPEIEMVLWSFPNDRKIHTLPAAIAAAHRTPEFLPNWLASHRGPAWRVVSTRSNVVHYVGEHTCTVRMSVDLLHTSQHTPQTMTIFGKTYYDDEGAQTDRVMRQLWESESRRSGRLGIAQPLWYDAGRKTLWQLGIQGSTLETCALENLESISLFTEAAHAIATFHATPLLHLRPITIPNLIGKLGAVGSMLMQCRPSCRPVLVSLLTRLTAQSKMIPASPTATLHGDLHLKNLFLTDGKIALIDLDNVCEGPPGWDSGSFVAGLLTGAVTKRASLSQLTNHLQTFLTHYNQSARWKVDQHTLAWFTAVALVVERSYRCVTRLKDGRLEMIDALLDLADRISKTRSLHVLDSMTTRRNAIP